MTFVSLSSHHPVNVSQSASTNVRIPSISRGGQAKTIWSLQ